MNLILVGTTIVMVNSDTITLDIKPTQTFEHRFNATEVKDTVQNALVITSENLLKAHLCGVQSTDKVIGRATIVLCLDFCQCKWVGSHV